MKLDLAQPVPGPRIVPFGEDRLATDVLENGRPAFRITQRFGDINPAFPQNGMHRATDLGNWSCGDAVYAVWDGKAKTIGPDQYGALGIIIDHGGWTSLYWHLNGFSIARGDAVPVKRGQQIGIVGKTGLGATCHLHFELSVNGTKVDPEPHLLGAPLVIEEPVASKPLITGTVRAQTNLRTAPSLTSEKRLLENAAPFSVIAQAEGASYTVDGRQGTSWLLVRRDREWWVAAPLVSNLALTPEGKAILPPVLGDTLALEATLTKVRQALPTLIEGGKAQVTALEALGKVVG
jgi:hypothetical protein